MFFKSNNLLNKMLFKNFNLLKNILSKNRSFVRLNSYNNCSKLKQFLSQNGLKVSPNLLTKYQLFENELKQLKTIKDKDLIELVTNETKQLNNHLKQLEELIINESIVDDIDINELCLDLNCGVGGQEAMIFTKELFEVYLNFCDQQNWNYSLVANDCDTDFGGSRHSSVIVSGNNCYQLLRHEAGVHRVQRVRHLFHLIYCFYQLFYNLFLNLSFELKT
jgi:protein subunit release factor A